MKKYYVPLVVFIFSLIFALTGCSVMEKQDAIQTERVLSAAGFQMKFADSPQRIEQVNNLPQRKLIPKIRDGELHYVYADSLACKCIYVGSEKAYQRYQKLALRQQIAQEHVMAAEMDQDTAMQWEAWGPWGPVW